MCADDSETVSQPRSPGLVQLLTQSLQSAQQAEEVTVIPSLLISRRDLSPQRETESLLGSERIEDQVLAWFQKNDFKGDRGKKNLGGYPVDGYPGLFRKLFDPPPWVEGITMDEFFDELSEERERELRSLYVHCLECCDEEKLLETYREYRVRQREQFPLLSPSFETDRLFLQGWNERRGDLGESDRLSLQRALDDSDKGLLSTESNELDDLRSKMKLACLLGSETIESLHEAILRFENDFDEYSVVEGAPDLFLWHPNPAYNLWFFAEVKGPGDHLRESQSGWIRGYWEHIRGRVMILHVDKGL
ncbi:MAG: hypothetical protein NVSMB27_47340 [Ktedonobacteraceae bacterium]